MASEQHFSEIFTLTDDCFEFIFVWLRFEELCEIAGTCKHLQYIAGQYIRRKYPGKKMVIAQKYGKICIEPNGIQYVSQFVQNLEIHGSELKLFEYVLENCSGNIQRLRLSGGYMLSTQHITNLRRFLSNVKIIELYCCIFTHEFYETFLQYCHSLETLVIKPFLYECQSSGNNGGWLNHLYAGLKYFECDGFKVTDKFSEFFQLNKNIESFSAPQKTLRNLYKNSTVTFKRISLRLRPTHRLQPIEKICDHFKLFHTQKRFDRIHLIVHDREIFVNNADRITTLDVIEELTLDFCFIDDNEARALRMLAAWRNLKVLNIRHIGGNAELLSQALPSVEVLRVAEESLSVCEPFIRNNCKVREIFIEKSRNSNVHIHRLNIERLKLMAWHKLNVYVSEEAFFEIKRSKNKLKFPAIEIKLIDSHFSIRHTTQFPMGCN